MEVTIFKDDWYHKYINQTLRSCGDASSDAVAIAEAIMTAGAFIAQAIDASVGPDAEHHERNITEVLSRLSSTLYDIHVERFEEDQS